MTAQELIDDVELRFDEALEHFEAASKKIRTGRAHPSMLDDVKVEAYGVSVPLNQAATVNAVEAQLIQITPFDPNNLQAIADAIRNDQTLGLNPSDDGRVVRVPIPALNTERRQEIVKQLNEKVEECNIALRNIRHDVLNELKKAVSDKDISQDDSTRYEKQIEDSLAKVRSKVQALASSKEQEIMSV